MGNMEISVMNESKRNTINKRSVMRIGFLSCECVDR